MAGGLAVVLQIEGTADEIARFVLALRSNPPQNKGMEVPAVSSPAEGHATPNVAARYAECSVDAALTQWLASRERHHYDPKSERQNRRWVAACYAHAGLTDAAALKTAHIEAYLSTIANGVTANNHLGAISQFCKWARRAELLSDNPAKSIDRVRAEKGDGNAAFSPEQVTRLIAAAWADEARPDPKHRAIRSPVYVLAWYTGLRKKELRRLRWEHVVGLDTADPRLELDPTVTKNRKHAAIPLTPEAVEELARWRQGALPRDYVFPTPHEPGRPSVPHDRVVSSDMAAAGIPAADERGSPFGLHSVRKGFCTALAEGGASEMLAVKLMRHTDSRLTNRVYNKARRAPLREALRAVPTVTASPGQVKLHKPEPDGLDRPMDSGHTHAASPADPLTSNLSAPGLLPPLFLPDSGRSNSPGPSGSQPGNLTTDRAGIAGAGFEPASANSGSRDHLFQVIALLNRQLQLLEAALGWSSGLPEGVRHDPEQES